MAYGLGDQIEKLERCVPSMVFKPRAGERKWMKKSKLRCERRRAKRDPECLPRYRKYGGWEY